MPDKPFIRAKDYHVAPAPLAEAQAMVREHHYSKGGSNTAVYVHGLYEKVTDRLIGVAWWLPPTRVACESVNRAEWKRVLSLTRLVCLPDAPKNAASLLMGRSIELIRKDGRFVSLVTYADEGQNHTGAIYRATNWNYMGKPARIRNGETPPADRSRARPQRIERKQKCSPSVTFASDHFSNTSSCCIYERP